MLAKKPFQLFGGPRLPLFPKRSRTADARYTVCCGVTAACRPPACVSVRLKERSPASWRLTTCPGSHVQVWCLRPSAKLSSLRCVIICVSPLIASQTLLTLFPFVLSLIHAGVFAARKMHWRRCRPSSLPGLKGIDEMQLPKHFALVALSPSRQNVSRSREWTTLEMQRYGMARGTTLMKHILIWHSRDRARQAESHYR